jgi:hypothetical protein
MKLAMVLWRVANAVRLGGVTWNAATYDSLGILAGIVEEKLFRLEFPALCV